MKNKKKNHLSIDHSSLIGKKYDMFADSRPKAFFHPCHTLWELELYAPGNIVPVTVEVIGVLSTKEKEEEIEDKYPEDTYYGWYECIDEYTGKKKPERISMIWPRYSLFSMCFPDGFRASIERGGGIALALKITKKGVAMEGITMKEFMKDFHKDMKKMGKAMRYIILEALEESWKDNMEKTMKAKSEYFDDKLEEWATAVLRQKRK